ncbi:MAG: thioredoxin TrxC [Proteobacteria bacterium]|nr:thioredoxin TrxC [Pseudomonadota bacterium]MBU1584137.1 thioredoxin TrxC [Pseudomonadota bacterium]MBU2452302.1 thioredoxin TrxC [Pseudomonadota bacterium]MBU2630152.1 thioredoxin TrxC [Pseudomonadota bacterium]
MNDNGLILVCSKCGTKNRVPVSRIDEAPKCGKCGDSLPVDVLSRPINVMDSTFDKEVLASSLPVLVDCWAPWCGPCRAVGPILDALAVKYRARLKIVKLNVDENPGIGSRYSISSVPTMFLVKNGRIIDTLTGALPKEQLESQIARIL